jgi:nucleoside-diphosphate-sugar epimerase
METVLVTGGLGRSGKWIVDRLADDRAVVCLDVDHPGYQIDARPNVDFRAADLTDRGDVAELVAEVAPDAVVHWAALPSPERHAGGHVFENNVVSAYNVLTAAGRAGARVVQASSESAFGFPFARDTSLPDSLPVDEGHPCRPEDPYGTGKVVVEEIAGMVTRRYDVPVVSIRPSWIQYPGRYDCRSTPAVTDGDLASGVGNFWSYVDVRDIASAVEAALGAPAAAVGGHLPLLIAADDNYCGRPTVELFEEHFGTVPDDCTLAGEESAMSNARATDRLDWTADHGWREAATEEVPGPELVRD